MLGKLGHSMQSCFHPRPHAKGVALLAVAAALVVAGAGATFTLRALQSGTDLDQFRRVQSKMEKVYDALVVYAYRSSNLQLACPADPDGDLSTEDRTGDSCDTLRGTVPWETLGLSEADVISDRGGHFTYIIDQASVDLCNSSVGRTGTLDDLATTDTDSYLFALIDHGANGAGAVISSGNYAITPSSAEEQANCSQGTGGNACGDAGASITAGAFRSGPNSSETGDFFDDIVFVGDIGNDNSIDNNCLELASEDGDLSGGGGGGAAGQTAQGGQVGFDDRQFSEIFNETGDSDADQIRSVQNNSTSDFTTPSGEVMDGVRFRNDSDVDTRTCIWTAATFPIDSLVTGQDDRHTIRMFLQFGADSDTNDTLGDGMVVALATSKLNDRSNFNTTTDTFVIDGNVCGAPGGEFLGFEDDGVVRSIDYPSPVSADFRIMGVEIDTEDHHDGVNNFDNIDNHIAIVQQDIGHFGLSMSSNDASDSAACDVTEAGMAGSDGTVRLDGFSSELPNGGIDGDDESALNTAADGSGVVGCYANTDGGDSPGGTTTSWLEVGGVDGSNDVSLFHQMRIEIENTTTVDGICDPDELLMRFWVWPSNGAFDLNCPYSEHCSNLTDNYMQLQADDTDITNLDNPVAAQCMPWPSSGNLVHLGLVSGADVAGGQDRFTVRTFSAASDADYAAPTEAASTAETFELNQPRLTMHLVRDGYHEARDTQAAYTQPGLNIVEGIENEEQAEISSRFGLLQLRFDNDDNASVTGAAGGSGGEIEAMGDRRGISVAGIGNTEVSGSGENGNDTSIDNFYDSSSDTPGYNPVNLREAIEVRIPNTSYRKVALGLGSFELTGNGDQEEAIIDLYSEDTFIERHVVQGCDSGDSRELHKVVVIEGDSSNAAFNKVRITPNPIGAALDDNDASAFHIRGVKMCGTDRSCGLLTHSDCSETINVTEQFPRLGDGAGSTTTYTRERLEWLARDQIQNTGVPSNDISSDDSVLTDDPDLAMDIAIDVDEQYAWLHSQNHNGGGSDPYIDFVAGEEGSLVHLETAGTNADGFSVSSGTGDNNRIDGGGGDPEETLEVHFPYRWEQVVLSIGRFTSSEQVRLTAHSESTSESVTISACSGGNNNSSEVRWTPSTATPFHQIDITAVDNVSMGESEFILRGIKACDSVDSCTLDTDILPFRTDLDNCTLNVP